MAPISWLIASDVREGRAQLNFSEWAGYNDDEAQARLMYIAFTVRGGKMPLAKYVRLHPKAALSGEDAEALASWAEQAMRQ